MVPQVDNLVLGGDRQLQLLGRQLLLLLGEHLELAYFGQVLDPLTELMIRILDAQSATISSNLLVQPAVGVLVAIHLANAALMRGETGKHVAHSNLDFIRDGIIILGLVEGKLLGGDNIGDVKGFTLDFFEFATGIDFHSLWLGC